MLRHFLVSSEKGGVEDRVNLPPRGNMEVEGHAGDNLFDFKGTSSLNHTAWSVCISCLVKYSTHCNISPFSICTITAYLNHLPHTFENLRKLFALLSRKLIASSPAH